jgi:putative photosynthetic complex assembly protein
MNSKAMTILPNKPFAVIFIGLALIVVSVGLARLLGFRPPPSLAVESEAVSERRIQFEDAAPGQVVVRDAATQEIISTFGRGEGTFVRAALRALVNDRRHKGALSEDDFRLELHASGQLYLIDEATGKTISLHAYGPANSAAFAAFLPKQKGVGQ